MFRDDLFNTGPESAGAESGPTCYRYFSLGYSLQTLRVLQEGRYRCKPIPRPADHGLFPRIFGKSEKEPLDFTATTMAFDNVSKEINHCRDGEDFTLGEVAYG